MPSKFTDLGIHDEDGCAIFSISDECTEDSPNSQSSETICEELPRLSLEPTQKGTKRRSSITEEGFRKRQNAVDNDTSIIETNETTTTPAISVKVIGPTEVIVIDLTKPSIIDLSLPEAIDLTTEIDQAEQDFDLINFEIVQPLPTLRSENPVLHNFQKIATCRKNGEQLRDGITVEVNDGCFLLIRSVLKNFDTGHVKVQGLQLRKSEHVHFFSSHKGELIFIYNVCLDDTRSVEDQSTVQYDLDAVVRSAKLIHTNTIYPNHSDPKTHYTVRWKLINSFTNPTQRKKHQVDDCPLLFSKKEIISLNISECQVRYTVSESDKRFDFRGATNLGGSSINHEVINDINVSYQCGNCKRQYSDPEKGAIHVKRHRRFLNAKEREQIPQTINRLANSVIPSHLSQLSKKSTYTFADNFGGAGGTSSGAVQAGFKPTCMVDFDRDACHTYKKNHPQAMVHLMSIFDFIKLDEKNDEFKVDVAHSSTPCPVFSPANTSSDMRNKEESPNYDAMFCIDELLKKQLPRVATLEQTFGILSKRWRLSFETLIRFYTDVGFSLSWQLVDLQYFGLPQKRKRLIIIASCPGESLPAMPKYTHSEHPPRGSNMANCITPSEVLRSIPLSSKNHNVTAARGRGHYTSWDAKKLINTITGAGMGGLGHPSGTRRLTHRELAALQGYPLKYEFMGGNRSVVKQIGNSVPPSVANILLKSVIKHLRRADSIK